MTRTVDRRLTYILCALVLVQVAAVISYWLFFNANGYLPLPFLYDKFDTFMDLYNSLYWAGNDGRYSLWGSVYPPLNFILLHLVDFLFVGTAALTNGTELRSLTLGPAVLLVALHLAAPFSVVLHKAFAVFTPGQRPCLAAFCALSQPLLFSLERGNLIILTLYVLPFALFATGRLQVLANAVLINLKPYYFLLLVTYLLAGKLRKFVSAVLVAGGLFSITGVLIDPNFLMFLPNLVRFSQDNTILSSRELLALPSSLSAFSTVILTAQQTSLASGLTTGALRYIGEAIELAKWSAVAGALMVMVWKGRRLRETELAAASLVIIINLGVWVGGYSQMFYLAIIPILWTMKLRKWYMFLILAIFAPLDYFIVSRELLGLRYAFLSDSIVLVEWQLGIGSFIRPVLNFVLMGSMAVEFLYRGGLRQVPRTAQPDLSLKEA